MKVYTLASLFFSLFLSFSLSLSLTHPKNLCIFPFLPSFLFPPVISLPHLLPPTPIFLSPNMFFLGDFPSVRPGSKRSSLPTLALICVLLFLVTPLQPVSANFPIQIVKSTTNTAAKEASEFMFRSASPKLFAKGPNPVTARLRSMAEWMHGSDWVIKHSTDTSRAARYGQQGAEMLAMLFSSAPLMAGQMALMHNLEPERRKPVGTAEVLNAAIEKYYNMALAQQKDVSDLTNDGARILLPSNMTLGIPSILDRNQAYSTQFINTAQNPDLTSFDKVGALLYLDPSYYLYSFDSPPTKGSTGPTTGGQGQDTTQQQGGTNQQTQGTSQQQQSKIQQQDAGSSQQQ
ncbi:MAG: hypothetical protein DHS80DRAFT_24601 [Piptocephalis tieghemiana]|nr:MAG: hypothetical protein DHS80DRAFT_24601 [Piptocephalis tieghemiana]